jgi:hypothetical protein
MYPIESDISGLSNLTMTLAEDTKTTQDYCDFEEQIPPAIIS